MDIAPLSFGLAARSDPLRPENYDAECFRALDQRFQEMLQGAQLDMPHAVRERAFQEHVDIPHRLQDVHFDPRLPGYSRTEDAAGVGGGDEGSGGEKGGGGYLTMASIERRTRYLPLDKGVSALYSASTSTERATRASAASNKHVQRDGDGMLQGTWNNKCTMYICTIQNNIFTFFFVRPWQHHDCSEKGEDPGAA
jgi:hypothetical protein